MSQIGSWLVVNRLLVKIKMFRTWLVREKERFWSKWTNYQSNLNKSEESAGYIELLKIELFDRTIW